MSIPKLVDLIRAVINKPRKHLALRQDHASFMKMCSSLDVIGDSENAIDSYLDFDEEKFDGIAYLLVYGLLQALYLQQDAVKSLCESLSIKYTPTPSMKTVREVRNNSIGHPTSRYDKQFNFIVQISMLKWGFELHHCFPDPRQDKIESINLKNIIDEQRKCVTIILQQVFEELKKQEQTHKEEFRMKLIASHFPDMLHYYFEKIFEAVYGSKDAQFGTIHIMLISDIVDAVVISAKERGIYEAYEGLKSQTDQIANMIMKIRSYFLKDSTNYFDSSDAVIFVESLRTKMDELKQVAEDIDKDYAS